MKHNLSTEDSWFGFSDTSQHDYVTLNYDYTQLEQMTDAMINKDKQDYLAFIFKESAKEQYSQRRRVTIWNVLSDLGGIMEIIVLSVPLFIGSYRKFKFDADLLSELYLTKTEKPVERKKIVTNL